MKTLWKEPQGTPNLKQINEAMANVLEITCDGQETAQKYNLLFQGNFFTFKVKLIILTNNNTFKVN